MSTQAFFQRLLSSEQPIFRRVVGAVVEEGVDYRPEPKARSAGELIGHLIGHNLDLVELVEDGVIHHRNQVPFGSLEGARDQLDRSFVTLIERLATVTEVEWQSAARFYAGEHLVAEGPREQLAWMMFLDAVHHRGQLSTYLRPMGSAVPAIYGPSADDKGMAH